MINVYQISANYQTVHKYSLHPRFNLTELLSSFHEGHLFNNEKILPCFRNSKPKGSIYN